MTWANFDWANLIAAASAAIALLIFFIGVLQYGSSERWKRAEFVATQIKRIQRGSNKSSGSPDDGL
jgi:hypothetical protein